MRGATNYKPHYWRFCRFQPTLPMRGATKGRDVDVKLDVFQPTLPMRGATVTPLRILTPTKISTHAPHAGSDQPSPSLLPASAYFNPRSPCGERHVRAKCKARGDYISTHAPHAGSDCFRSLVVARIHISTHAPHAGSDSHLASLVRLSN